MSYVVRFTHLASNDIDEIIDYISKESPNNALGFIDSLEERVQTVLSLYPESGSKYKGS